MYKFSIAQAETLASLKDVLRWKKQRNSEKDQRHIELIEKYLNTQKQVSPYLSIQLVIK